MDAVLEAEIRDIFRALEALDETPVVPHAKRSMPHQSAVFIMDGPVFDAWAALAKSRIPHDLPPDAVGFYGRTGVWGSIGVAFQEGYIAYADYFVQGQEAARAWDEADEDTEGWLRMMLGATEWNVWELVEEA